MTVEVLAPAMQTLIDPNAELVSLGGEFIFTEGPVWNPGDQCLYFSDIPGDARWRWSDNNGWELLMKPTFKGNGLTLDRDRNIIACEQSISTVTRYFSDGKSELLAYHSDGTYLNSPNDIITRMSDGSLYFSDPDYGRWNDWIGCKREPELGFKTVMRVPEHGGGNAQPLTSPDEFDQPNGLCFSPDESLLYVNDSTRAHIKVFDVAVDGSLSDVRLFHENIGPGYRDSDDAAGGQQADHQELHDSGAVDGMKCDALGNVWVTGPGGVWIISPEGEHLGVVHAPEVVGNLTWGGPDLHTLFIMTSTTIHTVRTLVGPAPLLHH